MNFQQEVLEEKDLVLVDFYNERCPPCRMLTPIINNLTNVIKVVKLNTDGNFDLCSKYQVSAIPTMLFFKNGEVIKKLIGFHSEEQLRKIITELL